MSTEPNQCLSPLRGEADGGSGNRQNGAVTSGTLSGRGTKIAIEVFATGVTTPLGGMQLRFDFDTTLLTFVKAENSAGDAKDMAGER